MGDFNAKVGRRQDEETFIGPFGGDRNERGERLAAMAESRRLFIANTFFQKRAGRRWTWISPNGEMKNEINFILTNRLQIVQDVTVIGKAFSTGSDHRLVRARIILDSKMEKKALAISNAGQKKTTFDAKVFQQHVDTSDWTPIEDLDDDYAELLNKLKQCRQRSEVLCDNHQMKRISNSTRELLDRRRQMKRITANNVEYHLLCKLIRRQLKEDHDAFRRQALLDTAEKHRSLKKCRRNLTQQRVQMSSLTTSEGLKTKTRTGMERECTAFYTNLFRSKIPINPPPIHPSTPTSIPDVLNSEVRYALQQAENGKVPGKDRIEIEMLKAGGPTLWQAIADRFSRYIQNLQTPSQWKESKTVLLFKKGDKEDLKNYRPICLPSSLYKLFTKIVLNRLTREFDEQQPKEQAGFRSGYSTINHMQVLNQLIERCREYKMPLILAFVDYEKAFNSVEFNAVLQALHRQGFDSDYIALLKELNTDCTTDITLFYKPLRIPIGRGMEFTSGLNIDGEKLTHLRFADDIILIGDTIADVQKMLSDLDRNSKAVGLRMNRAKTKWMRNQHADADSIKINDEALEEVSSYVYLGQELTMNHDISRELARRRKAAWVSFASIREPATSTSDAKLRAHLFNSTVLPALIYGSETWSLTKKDAEKLAVTERAMERRLLKISLHDRIPNKRVRELSKVKDVVNAATRSKLRWAGHIARYTDGRWTSSVTEWFPRDVKRTRGRPATRWEDSIAKEFGRQWRRGACDRR
uniref:Reverse transcriptase domain-containing protein n=1 Tax=Plectus sambesii TaxID=2011161 RepID=A0A914UST4_9BILA